MIIKVALKRGGPTRLPAGTGLGRVWEGARGLQMRSFMRFAGARSTACINLREGTNGAASGVALAVRVPRLRPCASSFHFAETR